MAPDPPARRDELAPGLAARLAQRGIRLTGAPGAGTSCTRLYQAVSGSGERLVVKVLGQDGEQDRVDGHDLTTFRTKRQQIEQLRLRLPALAACYVPILAELGGDRWAAHVMPYVGGDDLLAAARADPAGGAASADQIAGVLGTLAATGYAASARPCTGDDPVRAHVDRIRRRLRFLHPPVIPAAAITGPGCRVNGVPCRPLLPLLDTVLATPRLRSLLRPRMLSAPVHGDLNTRNVLLRPPDLEPPFALVDPRGTLEPVDACYDIGKIVLSATLWDPLLRMPAAVTSDGTDDGVQVAVPLFPGYADLLGRLPQMLAGLPPLAALLAETGPWRARLAFIHAVHAVAEAACRVSDARARGLPVDRPPVRDAVRAFFYAGLMLLNDVVSRLHRADDIDLADHWRILQNTHRLTPGDGGYARREAVP